MWKWKWSSLRYYPDMSAGTKENHENNLRIADIRTQYLASAACTTWLNSLTSKFPNVIWMRKGRAVTNLAGQKEKKTVLTFTNFNSDYSTEKGTGDLVPLTSMTVRENEGL